MGTWQRFFSRVRAICHAISVRSLEPRIEKTGSPETIIVYFRIRFCLFWPGQTGLLDPIFYFFVKSPPTARTLVNPKGLILIGALVCILKFCNICTWWVDVVIVWNILIYVSVNSSSAHPPGPPPGLCSFPNPGGGAIAEIFQPGGGHLDVFHHGDWRTITWQINSLEKILNSFANGMILFGMVFITIVFDNWWVKSFVYMK
jgi:hypothetical protein